MGELANDMVEGRSCSECGIYFEKEHGFPVLCEDCWNDQMKFGETPDVPKATENEL